MKEDYRLFVTDLVSIGRGPGGMMEGDKVVILLGFSMPVTL
jgi:hypothetical protein